MKTITCTVQNIQFNFLYKSKYNLALKMHKVVLYVAEFDQCHFVFHFLLW